MSEVLKVFLWGQEIGRLAWHDARKTTFFVYNPEFLKGTLDIYPMHGETNSLNSGGRITISRKEA